MHVHTTAWEDEENNRIVEFAVEYRLDGDNLEVGLITPKSVTFCDPATKAPARRIGVHTETGRAVLSRVFLAKAGHAHIEQQLTETGVVSR